MKTYAATLPAEVIKKIESRRGRYTNMTTIFHVVCFDLDCWAGVAGDGENGSYEWFVSRPESFESSDCGFGDSVMALRDVLLLKVVH